MGLVGPGVWVWPGFWPAVWVWEVEGASVGAEAKVEEAGWSRFDVVEAVGSLGSGSPARTPGVVADLDPPVAPVSPAPDPDTPPAPAPPPEPI